MGVPVPVTNKKRRRDYGETELNAEYIHRTKNCRVCLLIDDRKLKKREKR